MDDDGKIKVALQLRTPMNRMSQSEIVELVRSVEENPSQLNWQEATISQRTFELCCAFMDLQTTRGEGDVECELDYSEESE